MPETLPTLNAQNLETYLKDHTFLMLAHQGSIPKKIEKAIRSIGESHVGVAIATLCLDTAPPAIGELDLPRSGLTLVAFDDGVEIGRIYRPKAKELYDYVAFLTGNGPQPADRAEDDKPAIGVQAARPMHITQKNFKNAVLKSNVPVLVDMWAPWCGPCHAIAPVLEELAAEWDGQARVAKINIDENQRLARQFGVASIPTLLIIKDGQEVDRLVGAQPGGAIRERMAAWLD